MKYSLITTIYNDVLSVEDCVNSLAPGISPEEGEWVIVDAGSSDGTIVKLRELTQKYTCMRVFVVLVEKEVITRGEGRRIGASLARGRILIHSIDADLVYVKGAVDRILHHFDQKGEIPIAGDGYFIITAEEYWENGGHPPLQQEEDFQLYERLKKNHRYQTQVLNVWYQHKDNGIVSQTNPTPWVKS